MVTSEQIHLQAFFLRFDLKALMCPNWSKSVFCRMLEQANDLHKRKAIECSQTSADYKAQLEKCTSQLNDAQQVDVFIESVVDEKSHWIFQPQTCAYVG